MPPDEMCINDRVNACDKPERFQQIKEEFSGRIAL
jgi:hypothetical protein